MFKLIAIGGKIRGKEIVLAEGENILGRDPECKIPIAVEGVSKNHLKITINGESAYLEDMGSSNGTLVNGKLVKKITIVDKDKIALPNVIFQLVLVKEKKIITRKKVFKVSDGGGVEEEGLDQVPSPPSSPVGKVLHTFQYRIMPVLYTFNKEYEWRSIIAVLLTVFIAVTISLTIFPVLVDSKKVLLSEIGKRGLHYAEQIARMNAIALSRKNLDSVDTKFLESEPGVENYELFDTDGRIVRPLGKLNDYITDYFSIEARDKAGKNFESWVQFLDDGQIGISKSIKAYNVKSGVEELVGIIAIKFAPASLMLEAANNSKAYLESFTTSALVGIIFFAMIYYLTIKSFDDIRIQIDHALRGKQKEISPRFMMTELRPLTSAINALLQKYHEFNSAGGTTTDGEIEEDGKYIGILKEFLIGNNGAAIVLNSEKLIQAINHSAEDLTGIRESAGIGMSLLDVARDQGFAATVIDLCDQSANNGGVSQKGNYDLSGNTYAIYSASLIGKDNFAKAYYITFIKE